MKRPGVILLLVLAACAPENPEVTGLVDGVPFFKAKMERLPDLQEPRGGSVALVVNGELTVFGGHTDGFRLLSSAEYYKGGRWNSVPMNYPHDFFFATPLPDGKVMLGGGCAETFGIGQSFGVEIYDAGTHTFMADGIMERKRAGTSARALSDGTVVIAGNWYAPDAIEIYMPGEGSHLVKEVREERSVPMIFPIGPDDAIIVGGESNYGKPLAGLVDRLREKPQQDMLPFRLDSNKNPSDDRIGEYAYLFKASTDSTVILLKLNEGRFSQLETLQPIPQKNPAGQAIRWTSHLTVDRPSRTAYLQGLDAEGHIYLAKIGYDATFEGGKASVEVLEAEGSYPQAFGVLYEGGMVFAGGTPVNPDTGLTSNFSAGREVWLLRLAPGNPGKMPWWPFLLVAAGLAGLWVSGRKKPAPEPAPEPDESLMSRITRLMEEEELFRRKDLKKADVAALLGTNTTYVSATINSQTGKSFSDLVNGYRIRYAKQLLLQKPELPMLQVGESAGFASETSFFRCFKAATGQTPGEWKSARKSPL